MGKEKQRIRTCLMADGATIFIPDISGYTRFMSQSQLDHNAIILSKLIECIIECNKPNFTVSEVEGDAVLFYKIGPPVDFRQMVDHCLEMFGLFHDKLVVMEDQAPCKCDACREIHQLKLKFIIHYGDIKVVPVGRFEKATGVDMIVAHRLLKNKISGDEYILATRKYLNHFAMEGDAQGLSWTRESETYANIGQVDYDFATLGNA
jgi:hypothetical protein